MRGGEPWARIANRPEGQRGDILTYNISAPRFITAGPSIANPPNNPEAPKGCEMGVGGRAEGSRAETRRRQDSARRAALQSRRCRVKWHYNALDAPAGRGVLSMIDCPG